MKRARGRPPRRARRWRLALLSCALFIAAGAFASYWILPWLGRRGDLNAIIESLLSSSLNVPVRIGNIVSEPLSELTVTRLESVRALDEGRLHLQAAAISVTYDPVELLSGRIRSLLIEEPRIYLNLDAPLAGLARLPEPPTGWRREEPLIPEGTLLLPFTVGTIIVRKGALTLRFEGRDLPLAPVEISVWNLGMAEGQEFSLSAAAGGGWLRASGRLDVEKPAAAPTRYVLHALALQVTRLPLESFLSPAGGARPGTTVGGTVDLEGSAAGAWPERIDLRLTGSAAGVSLDLAALPAVRDARIGLDLTASMFGDLERLELALAADAAGSVAAGGTPARAENAGADIRAEFRRREGDGGTLAIHPSRASLGGVGEVIAAGTITSLFGASPRLRLTADLPGVAIGEVLARVPAGLLPTWLQPAAGRDGARGSLALHVDLGGTPGAPLASGTFATRDLEVPYGAGTFPAAAAGCFGDLRHDEAGRIMADQVALTLRGLPAGALAEWLGAATLGARGDVDLTVDGQGWSFPPECSPAGARAQVTWTAGGFDSEKGFAGAGGIALDGRLEAAFAAESRELALAVEARARVREVLLGLLYGQLEGDELSAAARGHLAWDAAGKLASVNLEKAEAATPFTGPVAASGRISRPPGTEPFDLVATVQAAAVPLARAFPFFVLGPLGASAADGEEPASMEGEASVSAALAGTLDAPWVRAMVSLPRARLRWRGVAVDDLALEVPADLGPAPAAAAAREGFLRARRVTAGPATVEALDLRFQLAGGSYDLVKPVEKALLGGRLALQALTLEPRGRGRVTASLRARGLEVEPLARALGIPEFPGQLDATLTPVSLAGGSRLEARGSVVLRAFGGSFTFTDLEVENIVEPYSDLHLGAGKIEGVRLRELGDTFHFGIMSGVLKGEVLDLRFTGGEISAFDLDVETVRVEDVPQYLDRRALESIRRVLSGVLGAIEESIFSRFRYYRFGFWARLRDGVLRLQGKYRRKGVEYLMYSRWHEFPSIQIVNGRPEMPYDWRSIVENLKQVYEKGKEEP